VAERVPVPKAREERWNRPMFAASVSLDTILRIAEIMCSEMDGFPPEGSLDLLIMQRIAVELFRRGVDYRRVPWLLRLEHVRMTGRRET
jgi:hypothetical protein